ncbi:MAG: ATP-binding protein [Propionibacteriaceae bacterium]|jgi:predicted AAA+ superfamily ATPase|nr:ATP-binding protein [Propionibacteriaceae bacterium]
MVNIPKSPLGQLLPRRAAATVEAALADTRVVLVNGARQCGKSTLAAQLADKYNGVMRSLDAPAWRESATADPNQFLLSNQMLVIDEVQRVPDLLLSIKHEVDSNPRPGAFLLTGSARLMGLREVSDALPGRMETIELWPLSQGEIDQTGQRSFIDVLFSHGTQLHFTSVDTRHSYIERLVRGGFPEAVARADRRRTVFHNSYVADLVNRDVMQVAQIERSVQLRQLIRLIAARSGQLLVPAHLSKETGLPVTTIRRYLVLLEEVFLIKRIPAWSRNLTQRAITTEKVAFVDSGIAASQLGYNTDGLTKQSNPLGGLLEGFVAMELARQLSWCETPAVLYHYRTKDQTEVDLILEDSRGRVVAIDVKASSTPRAEDFRGIAHLESRLGNDFIAGIVLYTGTDTVPFGARRRAMPISAIWNDLTT